jgi:hypothetical protein
MILPDVNVLIYAFRSDVPQHQLCREWLDSVIMGDAPFALSRLALAGVIRVTTNPRAYREPSSLEDAVGFCDDLLGQPHCLNRASATGGFSNGFACKRTQAGDVSLMFGSRRWRSNGDASGLRLIATLRVFRDCSGERPY